MLASIYHSHTDPSWDGYGMNFGGGNPFWTWGKSPRYHPFEEDCLYEKRQKKNQPATGVILGLIDASHHMPLIMAEESSMSLRFLQFLDISSFPGRPFLRGTQHGARACEVPPQIARRSPSTASSLQKSGELPVVLATGPKSTNATAWCFGIVGINCFC